MSSPVVLFSSLIILPFFLKTKHYKSTYSFVLIYHPDPACAMQSAGRSIETTVPVDSDQKVAVRRMVQPTPQKVPSVMGLPKARPVGRKQCNTADTLLLLFASTTFCDFWIPTILRVLIFAISRSQAKFCDFAQPKVKAQL